jgi:peptide/nickel transport system ATP-binding protein
MTSGDQRRPPIGASRGAGNSGAGSLDGGSANGGEAAARAPTLATAARGVSNRTEEGDLPAVRDVSLSIRATEALGLVGESGSGKTTFALGAIGYLPENGRVDQGSSRLHGVDLVGLPRRAMRGLWGSKIGLVSQDPQGALNPTLTIGRQLDEMAVRHLGLRGSAARQASLGMLERVAMLDPGGVVQRYPHQLSGGMLQRAAIAMALLTHPDLLILDEPTTALDVTTQALILDLLEDLRDEFELAILYITHNLGVVARFCDTVAVMYAGEVFEEGGVVELFSRPLHPYTANLLHCVPRLETSQAVGRLATLPGGLPPLNELPPGCIFAPRCPMALESCRVARPPLVETGGGRRTACLRWTELLNDDGQREAVRTDGVSGPGTAPAPEARPALGPRPAAGLGSAPGPGSAAVLHAAAGSAGAPLLTVTDAVKDFPGPHRASIRAVDGVSLSLEERKTFGLVGESGSGKTTLARMVTGLTPPTSGRLLLEGQALRPTVGKRDRDVLRRLQMVFQSPERSLNPRRTVRQELVRPLMRLAGLDRRAASERALELLTAVRLSASYLDRYPGELSGGEKQRVAIARAFVAGPDLVVCDEPRSSLDVSVQGALMNLLLDLQDEAGTSYLFISHDLAAVQHLSHFIGVMYLGRLVEQGEASRVLSPPYHPYTEALLAAVPDPDPLAHSRRVPLRGQPPPGSDETSGCPFHSRCPRYLGDICASQEPPWRFSGATGEAPGPRPGGAPEGASGAAPVAAPAEAAHAIRCHIEYEDLKARQDPSPDPPRMSLEPGS